MATKPKAGTAIAPQLPTITPPPAPVTATSVAEYLNAITNWRQQHHLAEPANEEGFLGQLWYRGVNRNFTAQVPGIYRPNFTTRANKLPHGDVEDKRRRLECEMLAQFRTAGAPFLGTDNIVEIYFIAQHFGMPTRLLDWSTNPLAALFFACEGTQFGEDGFVYAMDARQAIPDGAYQTKSMPAKGTSPTIPDKRLFKSVLTMRHSFVGYAIRLSFWGDVAPDHGSYILPVRPDNVPGRIGQQSSCFTLHMHGAGPMNNGTLGSIRIDARSKASILANLRQLNVNQFTTYYDLDHLSKEVKDGWGVERPTPDFSSLAYRLLKNKGPNAETVNLLTAFFGPDTNDKIREAADLWDKLVKLLPLEP